MKIISFSQIIIQVLLALCMLITAPLINAKRAAPIPVSPVEYNGVRYTAPHEKMGYVQAWDIKTNQLLWEKKIYDVHIDPKLEEDVQWVFIIALKINDGILTVINENNNIYELNLSNMRVRQKLLTVKPLPKPQINITQIKQQSSKPGPLILIRALFLIVGIICLVFAYLTGIKERTNLIAGYDEKKVISKAGLCKWIGIWTAIAGIAIIIYPWVLSPLKVKPWQWISIFAIIILAIAAAMIAGSWRYEKRKDA